MPLSNIVIHEEKENTASSKKLWDDDIFLEVYPDLQPAFTE